MDGQERAPLTRSAILDAALSIIDRDGIEGLTMRSLGGALGVDAMMIYRHVANKAALLDGVMGRIWAEVRVPEPLPEGGWEELLAQTMHELRRALVAHPRAVAIIATRPAAGAELYALLEQLLGALVAAGLEIDAATADLLNALVNYTVGHALAEAGDPVGGDTDDEAQLLALVTRFPNLAAAFAGGWTYDPQRQFDRALRAMISGWPAATARGTDEGMDEP